MSLNLGLFEEICMCAGAPGYEDRVREIVKREVEPLVDSIEVDNLGNLTAVKKGKQDKKVMAAAHMDEIGFIITHIDERGFLRFHTLGGFDPKTLTAQKVIVHGKKDLVGTMGAKPIHVMTQEEKQKLPKITDYYIDLGLPREEVVELVEVGNPVTRKAEFLEMGHCITSKSIDNRVAVFMLIETLKELKDKEIPYDFYAVFTTQEEVGLRGVSVASHNINPDFGFAIDTTIAYDTPGSKAHEVITELGKGVAIKIMDSSVICDHRMVSYMKKTADSENITYQLEVLTGGGTDTAMVQRSGKHGAIAGAISIPTRNLHQVIEMASKDDIENSIHLLAACISNLDKGNF